jgi:hypothetical protein
MYQEHLPANPFDLFVGPRHHPFQVHGVFLANKRLAITKFSLIPLDICAKLPTYVIHHPLSDGQKRHKHHFQRQYRRVK